MTQLDVDQAEHISQVIFQLECTIAQMEDDLEALCREHPQLVELNPVLLTQLRAGWERKYGKVLEVEIDLFRNEF